MRPRRAPLFLPLLLVLFTLQLLGCDKSIGTAPTARNGVLDLSGWSATRDGPIALDGQWAFYWDRLLRPEAFTDGGNAPEKTGYLSLPAFWQDAVHDGRHLPGTGQATFRLHLVPGPGVQHVVLRLFALSAAYRLWGNGVLIAESGVVGESAASETAHRSLILAPLTLDARPMDLVLQVSNHYFRRGGVQAPLVLAAPGVLERQHIRTWCWAMFFAGSLLIMAIYHFSLYFLKKKDVSTLYFGLYCLVLIGLYTTMDSSEWLIDLFLPGAAPDVVGEISLCLYAILPSILYRFYRSLYPKEFIVQLLYLCDARSIIFCAIILSQEGVVIYAALKWCALLSLFLNVCFLVMLYCCLRRGRVGSLLLFLGCIILSITSLNDLYRHIFSANMVNVLPIGLLAFVLAQALALAQRFSNAFTAVEDLSLALEANNATLQEEMDERFRLEKEIVNVTEEERRRLSHDLHDGLCQQLAGARLRCSALEHLPMNAQGVASEVAEISSLLEDSVRQAYALSRGLWPVEHGLGGGGLSLAELALRVGQSSQIAVTCYEDLGCETCVNAHSVQIYRIAQEAVTNAVKHANPDEITVSLRCGPDKRLTLTVRDDGVGRKAAARTSGGLGMRIMAHRARMIGATLSIVDGEPVGTVVTCCLECTADSDADEGISGSSCSP